MATKVLHHFPAIATSETYEIRVRLVKVDRSLPQLDVRMFMKGPSQYKDGIRLNIRAFKLLCTMQQSILDNLQRCVDSAKQELEVKTEKDEVPL